MVRSARRRRTGARRQCRAGRDVDVDDLAVLVDGPVDVAPAAGDLDVGLVDEPAVADRVAARPGRVGQERREALHPPVDGDVVDLDATLGEEFLDVAIGQPVAQVPAHREHDHLGREPEAFERRARNRGDRVTTTRHHPATLTARPDPPPTQQSQTTPTRTHA